jgi:hypothetical protein
MNNMTSAEPLRLSSKLTKVSKVLVLLLGIPIAFTIPHQTGYPIWAIGIFITLVGFCFYFSKISADAFLHADKIQFEGLFVSPNPVDLKQIEKIKQFKSKKHLYFYFKTKVGPFLVIAPLWGDGRKAILDLYEKASSNHFFRVCKVLEMFDERFDKPNHLNRS